MRKITKFEDDDDVGKLSASEDNAVHVGEKTPSRAGQLIGYSWARDTNGCDSLRQSDNWVLLSHVTNILDHRQFLETAVLLTKKQDLQEIFARLKVN